MTPIEITSENLAVATLPQKAEWCRQLERGAILYFPQTPVPLAQEDISFLLGQQQVDSALHKNIAYKPQLDVLSGLDTSGSTSATVDRLRGVMRGYSQQVTEFLGQFLAPYQRRWQLDYASFRPQEEEGRDLPTRRRNDLLHTDAFPTRPTYGARILRFFNNIHPSRTRDWITGTPFPALVREFVPAQMALPHLDSDIEKAGKKAARSLGLGKLLPTLKRSPYDQFMMRFHNFLKENDRFQTASPKMHTQFPPGSSWMVYTETVPHAVLSGQYALEQTFLVSPEAMVEPESLPLRVLESMAGARLT